jgi:hypothetical protein
MKTLTVLAAIIALGLFAPTVAHAAQTSGTTQLLGPATSGADVQVQVTVASGIPVVPYEYAIQNVCYFSGRASGNPDSIQRDDIVYWTGQDANHNPQTTMPLHLQSIPAGAACKVFLMRNNTLVKGSTTAYSVVP